VVSHEYAWFLFAGGFAVIGNFGFRCEGEFFLSIGEKT
jgi:hypothetical protein